MSVQVKIPLKRITEPAVASALSGLMLALGGAVSPPNGVQKNGSRIGKPKRRKPKFIPPDQSLSEQQAWDKYVSDMPQKSQDFLKLLEEQGKLTRLEAIEFLHLEATDNPGKALGGIIGSMTRWASRSGVEVVPFAKEGRRDNLVFTWTGF